MRIGKIFMSILFSLGMFMSYSWAVENEGIDSWNISLGVDDRVRFEYTDNYELKNSNDKTKLVIYNRFRLNLKLSYEDIADMFIEGLDAREGVYRTAKPGQSDDFDLHQANIELKNIFDSSLSLKVGRQKLSYGEKRLLAAPTWSNKVRSFDAARIKLKLGSLVSDWFVGNVVSYDDNNFNDGEGHEVLSGVYNTYNFSKKALLDFYFLSQVNKESSELERYTVGKRINLKLFEDFEIDFEAAYQFGKNAGKDTRAYGLALYAKKKFDLKYSPALKVELNLASGDSDLSDNKYETFVPIYQTTHGPYGIMDLVRWQNIREIALIGGVNITEKLSLQPEMHWYWLDSDADAWYKTNGSAIFNNTVGNTNNEIGTEASLVVKYDFNKNMDFELGYSRFFSGAVAALSGENDHINFTYCQTIIKF